MIDLRGLAQFAIEYGLDGGAFRIPCPETRKVLLCVASYGDGWDHVSVSLPSRTPTWAEMAHVKLVFFKPHETAFQLHVPEDDHINLHPHCLHLWRPQTAEIPRPPGYMVGPLK